MPATFDAASFSSGSDALSWTHTPVGTPTLVVLIGYISIVQGGVATYGGSSMTILQQTIGAGQVEEIWYQVNPLSGARTVTYDNAGLFNQPMVAGVITFIGTVGAPDNQVGAEEGDGDVTNTVSNTTIRDMVVQGSGNENDAFMVPQSGQTEEWDTKVGTVAGAGYRGAATITSTTLRVTGGTTLITAACRIVGTAASAPIMFMQ